uniref:Putative secreted protein n=1 Tax=Rhipicephalus microplus TaxID=6941 RepID=A0A6M2DE22_RHIMP
MFCFFFFFFFSVWNALPACLCPFAIFLFFYFLKPPLYLSCPLSDSYFCITAWYKQTGYEHQANLPLYPLHLFLSHSLAAHVTG